MSPKLRFLLWLLAAEIILFFGFLLLQPQIRLSIRKYIYQSNIIGYNRYLQKYTAAKFIPGLHFQRLNQKLSNPAPWALEQINTEFSNSNNTSRADVIRTFDLMPVNAHVVLFSIKNGSLTFEIKAGSYDKTLDNALKTYVFVFSKIAKLKYVKDLDFLLRLADDFPVGAELDPKSLSPILAIAKNSNEKLDKGLILIPDYMNLRETQEIFEKLDLAKLNYPWSKKQNKILWRGGLADVSGFRRKLVDYSISNPNSIIDARFCDRFSQIKPDYIPEEQQLKFKFLVSIDGATATWTRPVWQLYSNSVIIKQNSNLQQWFYRAIKPDVHYIATTSDPSELEQIPRKYSEKKLLGITNQAQRFAAENLTINDMLAYIIMVLQRHEILQAQGIAKN